MKKLILGLILIPGLAFGGSAVFIPNPSSLPDDTGITFGSGSDASCEYDTAQTPDSLFCGVGTDSRVFIIGENADVSTDLAISQKTNPTLHIHAADAATTTKWIELFHNGTNGVVDVGVGTVSIPDGITATLTGNASTATALAANGGNCAAGAGAFTNGVDASGVAENCSTATYPLTTTANRILYSSATNVVNQITTANSGTVMTDSAGLPTVSTAPDADGWFHNLSIVTATTTNANDSIRIQCGTAACSSTNSGWVDIPGTTVGTATRFTITADVTLLLTGTTMGMDAADVTGALVRVLLANDNGTLRTCAGLLGGRHTLLTTDTSATQANIDLPEEVLCNTAVGSATNTVRELGFVRTNFDTTGGAAENLFANQTGVGDIVTGQTADDLIQPCNLGYTGFSAAPTSQVCRWSQSGRNITIMHDATNGTSNTTGFTLTQLPAKAARAQYGVVALATDNSTNDNNGSLAAAAASTTLTLSHNGSTTGWTGSGTKNARFTATYEVGPVASFIE